MDNDSINVQMRITLKILVEFNSKLKIIVFFKGKLIYLKILKYKCRNEFLSFKNIFCYWKHGKGLQSLEGKYDISEDPIKKNFLNDLQLHDITIFILYNACVKIPCISIEVAAKKARIFFYVFYY